MRKRKVLPFTLLFSVLLSQSAWAIAGASIVELIANPGRFDEKKVQVVGFASTMFEGTAVYLGKADYDARLSSNAIWLKLYKNEKLGDPKRFHEHYVLIEGTFDKDSNGHMGLFSGSLKDITRMEIWHTR